MSRFILIACLALACAHAPLEKGAVVVQLRQGQADGAFAGRRFALLVAVAEAKDDRWRALRFANKDVEDLARVLRDPQGGRYDRVTTLTQPAQTTRSALLEAVRALGAEATRADDIVVLYVSAHGTLARDGRGELERYLVTADADFTAPSQTALAVSELQRAFAALPSKRRVLVLATCHSGGGKSLLSDEVSKELASLKGPVRPLEEASRAAITLSAADFGEPAREDEGLQNDVYTHFLVEALSGLGDRNGDGAVTATEAHDHARRKTWAFSNGRQRPSAEVLEVGADPIVLAGALRREGRPELFSYAQRLDGFALKIDGEERASLPGGAAVTPGRHLVELTKGADLLVREELSLEVGQRLDLDELVARQEPDTAVSVLAGGFVFIDEKSRAEVLPGGPTVGASLRFERLFGTGLAAQLDGSGFGGGATLSLGGAPIPFTWVAAQGGVSVGWQWRWRAGSAWAGARVAGLWVQRSFSLEGYSGRQAAFSMMPGAWLGGAVHLSRHWELSLNLEPMLSLLTVDGAPRAMGFLSGWAAMGYRF
ncbi:MAG: caspase family protein [Myxococcaceae bacterium]|nr:caspase family protein [Myxococcaceae bacterium]